MLASYHSRSRFRKPLTKLRERVGALVAQGDENFAPLRPNFVGRAREEPLDVGGAARGAVAEAERRAVVRGLQIPE